MDDIRNGHCPLCRHHEIIDAVPREFIGEFRGNYDLPLALAHAVQKVLFGKERVPQRDQPFGQLRTYSCRRCGYTQWFASKPAAVPIGDVYGTRLMSGVENEGPFR